MRKYVGQTQIKNNSTKCLTSSTQNCQDQKTLEDWETITDQRRLKRHNCAIVECILEQKKAIDGKTNEIQKFPKFI